MLAVQFFIFVGGFRCLFPNRYNENIVLHDTWLSSIGLCRCLATFSEVGWLYIFAKVAWDLNILIPGGPLAGIDFIASIMVF